MNISFNNIPVDIERPGVYSEIDNSKALSGVFVSGRRVVIIGQRLATGAEPAKKPLQIINAAEAEAHFGRGSQLAEMVKSFRSSNKTQELWAIALDDADAGVKATGTLLLGGTANNNATLNLMIAGYPVNVAVIVSEDLPDLATRIVNTINTDLTLPVTAVRDTTDTKQVNLTAKHKGECGNDIDLRVNYYLGQKMPKGLTLTITNMANGTTNPNVTEALSVFGNSHYKDIVVPYSDAANLSILDEELETRFTAMQAKITTVYSARKGTYSENIVFANTLNSKHLSIMSLPAVPSIPSIWAAQVAAEISKSAEIDPIRPYYTLSLKVKAPMAGEEYTAQEQEALLKAGLSTFQVIAGNVSIQQAITTYKVNESGIADKSYKYLNTIHGIDYVKEAWENRLYSKFISKRFKLADDGTRFAPGQKIVTPSILRVEMISLFRELEERGIVENLDQFKQDLMCARSKEDKSRANSNFPTDLVNPFLRMGIVNDFRI